MLFSRSQLPNQVVFEGKGPELAIPYGKFRWKVLTQDGKVQYSNEFYLKKK